MYERLRFITMLLPGFLSAIFFLFHRRSVYRQTLFFFTLLLSLHGIESLFLPVLSALCSAPFIPMPIEKFNYLFLSIRASLFLLLGIPFSFWLKNAFQRVA